MQGVLFLYITSVLLSKVIFQGTGTVTFHERMLHVRTCTFIVSAAEHQLRIMNLNDKTVTGQPLWSCLFHFKTSLDHIYNNMYAKSHQDSNSPYFSPIKEMSAAKPHHERMLLPNVFFNCCYIQRRPISRK